MGNSNSNDGANRQTDRYSQNFTSREELDIKFEQLVVSNFDDTYTYPGGIYNRTCCFIV